MAPRGKSRSDAQESESVDPAAGLLPAGLRDVLAPRAEWEAQASEKLLAGFARHGYVRVKPPLIEFEETLLRSEEHTSELQSLMRISYAVFCLQKKTT